MDIPLWVSGSIAGVLGCTVFIHYYYKNVFSYWSAQGINGPSGYPFVGNLIQLVLDRTIAKRWRQQYGKVYGIYWAAAPVLVVNDPWALRQICIKDFDKFPNHKVEDFLSDVQKSFLFSLEDDHWRRVRAVLSPTFTSAKMRRMTRLLNQCADDLLDSFNEWLEAGKQQVDLKEVFNLYTMDAIASCCYGLKMERYRAGDSLKSTRNGFVKDAIRLFEFKIWRMLVAICIDKRILKRFGWNLISNSVLDGFASRVEQIIKRRRESGRNFDDYLQILLEAKLENPHQATAEGILSDRMDAKERHHAGSEGEYLELKPEEVEQMKGRTLTELEILSSAMFLLVVGLETTSTLLTNCFYALSFHPKVAEKLHETIGQMATEDDRTGELTFDYDALTSCQYLDAVVSETLRVLPPAWLTDRVAKEDYLLKNYNVHLPKGSRVVILLGDVMKDEDYWSEPDKFDPERFMPENQDKIVPGSFCPFGLGPRHCLGMRFGLTEAKVAIAKLIMKFKFSSAPGTQYPPEMKVSFGLSNMKRPIVKVTRRD